MELLSQLFLRNYHRYADHLYGCYQRLGPFTVIDSELVTLTTGPPLSPKTTPVVGLMRMSVGCVGAPHVDALALRQTWPDEQHAEPQTTDPEVVAQQLPFEVQAPVQH